MKHDGGGFESSLFQGTQCQPAAALPRAVLVLYARSFAARGAACD
jgi:hypothetical protein